MQPSLYIVQGIEDCLTASKAAAHCSLYIHISALEHTGTIPPLEY